MLRSTNCKKWIVSSRNVYTRFFRGSVVERNLRSVSYFNLRQKPIYVEWNLISQMFWIVLTNSSTSLLGSLLFLIQLLEGIKAQGSRLKFNLHCNFPNFRHASNPNETLANSDESRANMNWSIGRFLKCQISSEWARFSSELRNRANLLF